MSDKPRTSRKPLIFSEVEDLRRRGYSQSEIAEMHGVSRQAVSWHKKTYGGHLTPRQEIQAAWPWITTALHSKSVPYKRLRDHGEFMTTKGKGMSDDKMERLLAWWKMLRDADVVVEFDPDIPPARGMAGGGFRYVPRNAEDGDLLIRLNEHVNNWTQEKKRIWSWPSDSAD